MDYTYRKMRQFEILRHLNERAFRDYSAGLPSTPFKSSIDSAVHQLMAKDVEREACSKYVDCLMGEFTRTSFIVKGAKPRRRPPGR